MFKEFKEFAMRGNVLDMAIGIILGGAFTPIVKSLVDDVLMPVLGLAVGDVDFSERFLLLRAGADGAEVYPTLEAAQAAGAVTLNWGLLVNAVFTFVMVAFAVFMMVRTINRWKKEEEEAPAAPAEDVVLLREIRDSLQRG